MTAIKKRSFAYGGPLKRHVRAKGRNGPKVLDDDHPAVLERRPLYPSTVVDVAHQYALNVLISGHNNRKLGKTVVVGKWAGMPIFQLMLPERSTCPPSCREFDSCYGNNLHRSPRYVLNDALMVRISEELDALCTKHPRGFVVRLHTLGDFGAPDNEPLALRYVSFWHAHILARPALHVFGFTAHDPSGPIGKSIMEMTQHERCWIRFSGRDLGQFGARVIGRPEHSKYVLCPYENSKVETCGCCGLCWKINRTIEFVRH